ncbi:MAG TPA: hypothetical protein VLE97_05870 [Gaiellaceae bacterium]|nr:hypothetical protein [Gaiellaceae bacterium]
MYGRGYYGQPVYSYGYAHPYAHYAQFAALGADPSAPPPPPGAMVPPPPDQSMAPPMQQVEHKIKVKPAAVHLSTGGFFQVAAAVTLGLIGAGVVAGFAGAAAVKYSTRGRASNGNGGRVGNGNGAGAVGEAHGARIRSYGARVGRGY